MFKILSKTLTTDLFSLGLSQFEIISTSEKE